MNAAVFRCLMRVVSRLIEIEADALDARTKGFALAGDSLAGSLLAASRERPGLLDSIEVGFDSLRAAPPLVTVRSSVAGRMRKIPSGFQASVPGNLVMFVLMTMVFSGAVITVERSTGVLRRYAYTPAGRRSDPPRKALRADAHRLRSDRVSAPRRQIRSFASPSARAPAPSSSS